MVVSEQRGRSPFWFLTGNVRVLVVCKVLWSFSEGIVYPFFSLYILALGGSPLQIGLINSLGMIASMFLYPVGGYIADKMGRVKLIGFTTYAYSFSYLPFIFATNWQTIALGQFLIMFFTFYSPAMNALQADSLPVDVRGRGFATIMAIPSAIRIIAPFIGGWIIAAYGSGNAGMIRAVRMCWSITFVTGLVVATIRLKYLKETIPKDEVKDSLMLKELPRIIRESYKSIFESVRWMNRSLRVIVVIEMLTSFFVAMVAPFWIVYANKVVGLTPYQWGIALLISGFIGILLAFPSGYLVDRVGPRRMILFSMGLAPPTIFFYLYSRSFYGVVVILCMMSLINVMMIPAFSTLIANMIPRNRRGRLYSLLGERGVSFSYGKFWGGGFLLFAPAAVGSFVGGYVYEINSTYPWVLLSVAMVVNLVLAVRYIREPDRPQT